MQRPHPVRPLTATARLEAARRRSTRADPRQPRVAALREAQAQANAAIEGLAQLGDGPRCGQRKEPAARHDQRIRRRVDGGEKPIEHAPIESSARRAGSRRASDRAAREVRRDEPARRDRSQPLAQDGGALDLRPHSPNTAAGDGSVNLASRVRRGRRRRRDRQPANRCPDW
jgi:hypothetical protein